jgi:hypothetical protein
LENLDLLFEFLECNGRGFFSGRAPWGRRREQRDHKQTDDESFFVHVPFR